MSVAPLRPIEDEEIAAYNRDGAVLLRGVFPREWLDKVHGGLDEIRQNPTGMSNAFASANGEGLTTTDQYPSLHNAMIADVVANSPAAAIAAALLGHRTAHYVLDQMFYKDAGNMVRTAWHQDTPYLRVTGHDLVRTWITCDPSPAEATVRVVRGSHRWNVTFQALQGDASIKAVSAGEKFTYSDAQFDKSLPALPDISTYPESFDIMSFDVRPGDVLAFNGNILHGALGDFTLAHPRRALAILWGSEEVRYLDRPGHSVPDIAALRGVAVPSGASIADYPQVFTPHFQQA